MTSWNETVLKIPWYYCLKASLVHPQSFLKGATLSHSRLCTYRC